MQETVEKIKFMLRINGTAFDDDIEETVRMCRSELILSGVSEDKCIETDSLILRAIKLYCKAEYSADEKEAIRCRSAYEALRNHLTLTNDYRKGAGDGS